MKKYKTINFLEENKNEKKNNKLYRIAMVLFLLYLSNNIYSGLKEIQNLEIYINKNLNNNIDTIEVMAYKDSNVIEINNIQQIYGSIGKNNITSLIANNSNLEIEGKCVDLNILDNIKNYEFIKSMSVNKIVKEGDAYIFNVSYELVGK